MLFTFYPGGQVSYLHLPPFRLPYIFPCIVPLEMLPFLNPSTCLISFHLPHLLPPASSPFTCLLSFHLPHLLPPALSPSTCLISFHLPHLLTPASSPSTCLISFLYQPFVCHTVFPSTAWLTSYLTFFRLPPSTCLISVLISLHLPFFVPLLVLLSALTAILKYS